MTGTSIDISLARSQALLDWRDGLYHNDNKPGSAAYKAYDELMREMRGKVRKVAA